MALEGVSPFERLRRRYDESDTRCGKCGHDEPEGGWRVTAAGSRIRYQRVCPKCGAVDVHELRPE